MVLNSKHGSVEMLICLKCSWVIIVGWVVLTSGYFSVRLNYIRFVTLLRLTLLFVLIGMQWESFL